MRFSLATLTLLSLCGSSFIFLSFGWNDWRLEVEEDSSWFELRASAFSEDNSVLYLSDCRPIKPSDLGCEIVEYDAKSLKPIRSIAGWVGHFDEETHIMDLDGDLLAKSRQYQLQIPSYPMDLQIGLPPGWAWVSTDGRKLFVQRLFLEIWSRRRSNEWWGVARLWEFWLAFALLAILGWSVFNDRRAFRRV